MIRPEDFLYGPGSGDEIPAVPAPHRCELTY